MRIEHVAIWVKDLEASRQFYMKYFQMQSNAKYVNNNKRFSSYFLSGSEGARLELIHMPGLKAKQNNGQYFGLSHLAFSVGSKKKVNKLTEQLRKDGIKVLSVPRTTGDGYYESLIEDIDGNHIEITV